MPEPTASDHAAEFPCPHCQGLVSARWEDLGETLECPHCKQPFDPPAPRAVSSYDKPGRRFQFQCLRCGSVLEARSTQAGRKGKCPTCAALFIVPELDPRTGLARTNADPGEDGENPTPVHAYAAAGDMAPRIHRKADDQLTIECPRCHTESPVSADNCSRCGLPFTLEGMTAQPVTSASAYASAALPLAILALPLSLCGGIGIIPAAVAIGLGLYHLATQRRRGFSMAHAAVIIGLAAIGLGVLVFAHMRL